MSHDYSRKEILAWRQAIRDARLQADVDKLIDFLRHPDPDARSHALYSLGRLGDPRAVGAITRSLSANNDLVRCNALRALGRLGDRSVIPEVHAIAAGHG